MLDQRERVLVVNVPATQDVVKSFNY